MPEKARYMLITVLDIIDNISLSQGTLMTDKALDLYEAEYIRLLLDQMGSHDCSFTYRPRTCDAFLDRSSSEHENTFHSAERVASVLTPACRLSGRRQRSRSGSAESLSTCLAEAPWRRSRQNNPLMPFIVNSVGWLISRLQPRAHGC